MGHQRPASGCAHYALSGQYAEVLIWSKPAANRGQVGVGAVLTCKLISNCEGETMKVETNATVLKVGWLAISVMVLLVMVFMFVS